MQGKDEILFYMWITVYFLDKIEILSTYFLLIVSRSFVPLKGGIKNEGYVACY